MPRRRSPPRKSSCTERSGSRDHAGRPSDLPRRRQRRGDLRHRCGESAWPMHVRNGIRIALSGIVCQHLTIARRAARWVPATCESGTNQTATTTLRLHRHGGQPSTISKGLTFACSFSTHEIKGKGVKGHALVYRMHFWCPEESSGHQMANVPRPRAALEDLLLTDESK
jgi:hypothetical protein